ncbi:MAG TPA: molybdenum cofactor guanylyltransferase MobA [Agitococcus sp.]|uniref:molybdenum cofactor guanylyltransferase MobA n=1 Tax=uncultured Agitococcus sp. TaxID=1506599 RepID=UPI00262802AC|nr:molybdenum cofactor guanylyltransferase MobA [uncultured Agitococcus sp.]HRH92418.1 molybdenum cofactor guanylyltransferase MobA [Agitococcus sp.]
MKQPPIFSTLILAGGKATRMNGQDKGLVIWQGQPLISHVLKNLPKDDIVISCNRNLELYQQYGRVISDTTPNFAGPLAGIAATLPHCHHDWVLITACDMPCLPIGIAEYLWQHLEDQKIAVAHDGEHLQPLLLLVHRSLAEDAQQQVSQGFSSVYKWLQNQQHTIVYFKDRNIFNNINRLDRMC